MPTDPNGQEPRRDALSRHDLDVAREHLPDAYGLQVLTSTHLAKARDLSA